MGGKVKKGENIAWNDVENQAQIAFVLKPGESFAFHDTVLPKYKDSVSL